MTILKDEWFNGNQDAKGAFCMIGKLVDKLDDLIDKDKPVPESDIIEIFKIALYRLPMNPIYRVLEPQIAPMWLMIFSSYETANAFERSRDSHGLELAHMLRYQVGQILALLVIFCVGEDKAREYLPEIWKALVTERFEDYRREHTHG